MGCCLVHVQMAPKHTHNVTRQIEIYILQCILSDFFAIDFDDEILKSFYGDDIRILTDTPVDSVGESYPGEPLRPGDDSNSVKVIQTELNRIAQNYPAIPKIRLENGFYGVDTEDAVRAFQRIFSLPGLSSH